MAKLPKMDHISMSIDFHYNNTVSSLLLFKHRLFIFFCIRELLVQKGAFSEFLAQHLQELDDDEGE